MQPTADVCGRVPCPYGTVQLQAVLITASQGLSTKGLDVHCTHAHHSTHSHPYLHTETVQAWHWLELVLGPARDHSVVSRAGGPCAGGMFMAGAMPGGRGPCLIVALQGPASLS